MPRLSKIGIFYQNISEIHEVILVVIIPLRLMMGAMAPCRPCFVLYRNIFLPTAIILLMYTVFLYIKVRIRSIIYQRVNLQRIPLVRDFNKHGFYVKP